MTDNEVRREQPSFEIRANYFKERAKEFFASYENPTGSEDRLEICLIRDGRRAVSKAEEEISCLKAEIERLKGRLESSDKQLVAMKEGNAQLYLRFNTARNKGIKEFAERYERYLLSQLTTATLDKKEWINFCLDELNNLVKEMEGD